MFESITTRILLVRLLVNPCPCWMVLSLRNNAKNGGLSVRQEPRDSMDIYVRRSLLTVEYVGSKKALWM
jgi:hypothetical protein